MTSGLRGALLLAVLVGCGGGSQPPCPTDDELLKRFAAQEAGFSELAKRPDDQALWTPLGVKAVQRPDEGLLHFSAWVLDFIGPGGAVKGYAHSLREPAALVDSIDANSSPGSAEQKVIYRRIKANWYLYYASSN